MRVDIEMTREIAASAKTPHIPVHDHLVTGAAGTCRSSRWDYFSPPDAWHA
jgi:DNA repair protein RadC